MTERPGTFITFEGPDGSGKTHADAAARRAARVDGREVVETQEPGGTEIGLQIRSILLDSENQKLCPIAEMLLYFAARAQNFDERILPAWERGAVVLSDRFTDSTLAYQGGGRELGPGCRYATPQHRLSWPAARPDHLHRYRCGDRAGAHAGAKRSQSRIGWRSRRSSSTSGSAKSTWNSARQYPERIKIVDGRGAVEDGSRTRLGGRQRSCLNPFYGNAAAVETLAQMIRRDRIPQTILLSGPEGIGKATLVRRFAAELLGDRDKIEHDDLSLPENVATIAEREKLPADKRSEDPLSFASHLDFVTFPPDGPLRQISIQQMRLLKERAQFGPLRGKHRVFLIDHIDRANEQAANSLLKILEEPPAHLLLFMTAENAYDLLPTIRSRSLILGMSPLSSDEMERIHARPGAEGFPTSRSACRGQSGYRGDSGPGCIRQTPLSHDCAPAGRLRRSAIRHVGQGVGIARSDR